MRKSSKTFMTVLLSVVLVLTMSVVAMFSAFADAGVAGENGTTAAPSESTTAAPVVTTVPASSVVDEDTTKEPTTKDNNNVVGMVGDLNGDGKVNSADARLVLRICAKLDVANALQKVLADANHDLLVRSDDARLVLRFAAKLDAADDSFLTKDVIEKVVDEDAVSIVYDVVA